ncbi:UDP-N-acetylenolpyruvoylglucosamine reductase [Desulfobacter hydrogenophilus]|uniref:UDP-N-acetylenolpyruvoylglucosamine reductase n=1 Tax=Desulfobacter hydrogenophilus TaxID=2291 RepID=A0A328FDM7_9BACT|nr:UDP-N-acetylmuramate dehydrogenase [Desulfobacter hydrogenophilus]NDY73581.1 UDP-N-acetylmuramate dehydrogenase [Desulfobacter hydrogenophilus]QBH13674.1 UDP-N-acetylmuramate dehydrogenase [Desulfobacter hydrogenophilus]RAM01860.1 UDP-N-acetylenolpyruvoylglucosamine reductase [Desulfobacter hydrogenophilus]
MVLSDNIKNMFASFAPETQRAMDRYTSFRVGGSADLLMLPQTVEQVIALVKIAHKAELPVTIIGGGTNILISDNGIRGLVMVLTRLKQKIEQTKPSINTDDESPDQIYLTALAGESLGRLCRYAADAGLTGLAWAAGIPGTIGGAVMMNAGAFGWDMSQIVKQIEILDLATLETMVLPVNDLQFSYRKLALENSIVLKVRLGLTKADTGTVRDEFYRNLKTKQSTQPVSQASAGCFFKNPPGDKSAGFLIEQAGMKRARCNGAMVSDLHANFIVNHGNACAKDILNLAGQVRKRVYEKFGINLKKEVKTIGD